ncbi:MAG TPA: hypothetical protein VEK35_01185 [Roseiarcus sp.]|nr:hypothetical protein [Roseiarcus sp.]
MLPPRSVSNLIASAFAEAALRNRAIGDEWRKISVKVGGRLPASLLIVDVQKMGNLDLVIRSMEDDSKCDHGDPDLQMFLSGLWVGMAYEVLRSLKARKLCSGDAFEILERDLKLIRIPLEKYEIPDEGKLDGPTALARSPPNNDASDFYAYVPKKDPLRTHIMPSELREGSVSWQVLDPLAAVKERWIVRRDLSDRILALWA